MSDIDRLFPLFKFDKKQDKIDDELREKMFKTMCQDIQDEFDKKIFAQLSFIMYDKLDDLQKEEWDEK